MSIFPSKKLSDGVTGQGDFAYLTVKVVFALKLNSYIHLFFGVKGFIFEAGQTLFLIHSMAERIVRDLPEHCFPTISGQVFFVRISAPTFKMQVRQLLWAAW